MRQADRVYTLGAELAHLICKILISAEPAQLFVSLVPSKLAASAQTLLRARCQLHLRPSSACFVLSAYLVIIEKQIVRFVQHYVLQTVFD